MTSRTWIKINNGDIAVIVKNSEISSLDDKKLWKRAERNSLLAESDSKILPDRGLPESKILEWKSYRQTLRDFDFSDPKNITWPTKPE